jgi:hypothetical protein
MLPHDWDAVLDDALHTPGWSELNEFVDQERKAGPVYPAAENVFRAFELTPYAKVRVVILGQDPYQGEGQAHGLAFSVAQGKLPTSLRKIRKELERDPRLLHPRAGTSKPGHARASCSSTQCSRCVPALRTRTAPAVGRTSRTQSSVPSTRSRTASCSSSGAPLPRRRRAWSPTRLTGSSVPPTRQLARVLTTPSSRRDRSPVRTRPWSKQVERGSTGIDRPARRDLLTGRFHQGRPSGLP